MATLPRDELQRVRAQLDRLNRRRVDEQLEPIDLDRYAELCRREVALLGALSRRHCARLAA